ncbi:type II toxin-antitoxin system HicB family antitoxin [Sphingomonas sp. UV9]|uniref:type II toxin-antitoxin system HicB family antitoxin n=1 Tax=Sphingomonas sp. UV9 TaxID=1851410 RepID=UPI000FFC4A9F|nr:type II toxin-antitoxin system HicB family antitoxin [Sphingomonas sp. UV9]RXD03367.1 type II toxin-antitoxin system HicB family antitoxin [Sphingomonas sp. UV9]
MKPEDYEVVIRPLPASDGGGYLATVPELPGCKSDGDTPQDALANAYDAIACWIEAAEELGRTVPAATRAAA